MFTQELVEKISDDFQSTFSFINEKTMANMMGFDGDFDSVRAIIKKYLPNAKISFHKTNELGKEKTYDIYLVKLD